MHLAKKEVMPQLEEEFKTQVDDMIRMERTIKKVITPIVRGLGGDEQDGGRHLTPQSFRLAAGNPRSGPIKVPLNCYVARSADPAKVLSECALKFYLDPRKTAWDFERNMRNLCVPTPTPQSSSTTSMEQ